MTNRFINFNVSGNGGDGIRIVGDPDVAFEGGSSTNNGGQGIAIYASAPWMRQYGLPDDTNPRALAELLQALQSVPRNECEQTVQRSSLFDQWTTRGLNVTSLAANIVSLSQHPAIQSFIAALLR